MSDDGIVIGPQQPAFKRVKTPTVLQMEAVECGAASLAMVLGYYGRFVPLEELRVECGVSRDGSKANNILRAARKFGLEAKGYRREPETIRQERMPLIVFWNFNHFVVCEGFKGGKVYLNDPASGPRVITEDEFDQSFTGVVITFAPGPDFKKGGQQPGMWPALRRRLAGSEIALLYAVITGLFLVIPGLVIPTFTRVFVDDILLGGLYDWLRPLLLGMLVAATARGALTWLQQRALLRLQTKLALASSSRFFWHVLRLPMEFYYQRFPGEISSRVQINDKIATLLSGQLATTTIATVTIVFYAVVMLMYDVVLTMVGIGFSIVNVLALRYVSRKRTDENQKLMRARGQVTGISMGGLQMMEDLKATGAENDFFTDWSGRYAKASNAEQALGSYTAYLMSVPPLLNTLTTATILAVGGLRVMDGHLSIGMLVAFQSLMASFMGPVNQLVNLGSTLQEIQGDMTRLDDVMRYPIDANVGAGEDDSGPGNVVQLMGHIELKNITFGWSKLEPPLIKDFNLAIKPGERVALVGGSGSGKSTVSKLIAGLFEPWEGEILFDGKNRSETPRTVLNNSVGFVDQDIFMFGGTIRENLTVWDSTVPEASVVLAGRDACIHDDIVVRRDGYDGTVAEAGANFSGGQRQRMEIARALVTNPTILVLDEATSALDTNTEKLIDDHLRRRGCTCIIVAHRLSTIRDADEILVMERGVVVQRGTHDEMKGADGPYARLIHE
jgi:NHLM bacteriocin system ABC transporter peptidase/ATP-binding protein